MQNNSIQKTFFLFLFTFLISTVTFSQDTGNGKIYKSITEKEISFTGKRYTFPSKYKLYNINIPQLKLLLKNAPKEKPNSSDLSDGIIFSMPSPDGKLLSFKIVNYNVMHPDLAAKFSSIQTFTGRGVDDPLSTIKLDVTQRGFHAMVLSPTGNYFIDPYCENNYVDYITYFKNDLPNPRSFICENKDGLLINDFVDNLSQQQKSSGTQLRTYRLALACTGEYAATKGGTVNGALSAMVTTMNRVNGVFESEVGIRMVMVANNNLICYLNASTDPYTNNNGSTMLGQNTTTCNNVIGSANYDIGHVFSTGGGGVAYLNGPCGSNKAGGVTGSPNPVGDAYDIDYVAHEMGHQFGANHTFNSTQGSCGGGNRSSTAAYEPGSGITIMAYAGICGTDDLSAHSIAYFHTKSFDEITTYTQSGNGNSCPVITNTGNTTPVVNSMGSDKSIPISTPFTLTGSATDADNDGLTYSWEEYDLGTSGAWNVQSTTAPMFRSFEPVTSGSRTFPKLQDILNNTSTIGELLPNQARLLKFRLTARDNIGGVMHPDNTLNISVVNNGGAFKVTAPNTAVTWDGGSVKNITWDVSGTTSSPISTAFVKISLSLDGGFNFTTTLLESTANTGSAVVTVPNIQTSQARIKVEAVGNIFFDINDKNFIINATTPMSSITTGNISPLSFCSGNTLSVPFVVDKNANAGNTFTAQISNASGSFSNPVVIGTLSSVSQGTINATLPALTSGNGYRIRVVSSNPAVTGSANTNNISIGNPPVAQTISANGPVTFCEGSAVILSGNSSGGTWNINGATTNSITVNTNGDYYVTNTNSCGTINSNHILVTVNPLPNVSAGTYSAVQTNSPAFPLTGSPAGGIFSGTGVSNNSFNPSTAGVGSFQINYTFTNGNGCTNTNTTQINVSQGECIFSTGTIIGETNACRFMDPQGGNTNYYIEATNASSYVWTVPENAVIISGQGTPGIVVDYLPSFSSGYITVKMTNACGGAPVKKVLNITSTRPYTPGLISGPTNPCSFIGSGEATYSINKVANATYYNWVVPQGVNILSHPNGIGENDTIIKVNFTSSFVSGSSITVSSGSYCGPSSSSRSIIIKIPGISTPSKIYGQTDVCFAVGNSTLIRYSIKPVTNAQSYNWTITGNATIQQHPEGAGNANDTVVFVKVNPGFTTGSIGVSATNGCKTSTVRVLNLFIKAPSSPAKIYGNPNLITGIADEPVTNVCDAVVTGAYLVYTINKVKVSTDASGFASSYSWSISDNVNAQIVHPNGPGANDTIVRVYFGSGFTSGILSVASERACKSSSARSISLTKKVPAAPGSISGPAIVCIGETQTYSVAGSGSNTYTWTVPSGIEIVSSQGTSSITLNFTNRYTGGTLRVSLSNACGISATTYIKLTKCSSPAKNNLITKVDEEINSDIFIYPNPSNGNLNMEFKNFNLLSKATISIINLEGKVLYTSTKSLSGNKLSLDLSSKLIPGVYILRTGLNDKIITKKIIIQR